MRKPFLALLALTLGFLMVSPVARAEDAVKPDDRVTFDLTAEDWVTTQTARVSVNVNAAVAGAGVATARKDMQKAVEDLAKGEWRLTSFNRGEDSSGLERWNAVYEARLPESALGGLHDAAKKVSRAGMQLTILDVDFSPTLAEIEAARAALRVQLYKQINDQLAALNTVLPARSYRISEIDFSTSAPMSTPVMPTMALRKSGGAGSSAVAEIAVTSSDVSMERAQKLVMSARVVFAALPQTQMLAPP